MAKKTQKERTINEVYELLDDFVGFTKNQFDRVDYEFSSMGKRFELVNGQLHIISKEIRDIKEEQKEMGKDLKMLKEDAVAVGKSIYIQHKTLENHGRRLVKLESKSD